MGQARPIRNDPGGRFQAPYPRNRDFTGREQVLNDLHAALKAQGTTALSQAIAGLGGVGKTQTAVEFAYRFQGDYRAVLWARADTESNLVSDYLTLAAQLGLPEKDARDPAEAREAVKRWLDREAGALLVLDNADEPGLLKPFLPLNPQAHILITTRAHNLDGLNVADPIALEVMSEVEAVAFLLKRVRRLDDERAAAARLAHALGYLPLALEQAAAYVKVHEIRFQDYLKDYETLRLKLLDEQGPVIGEYRETVRTTWTKSIDAVRSQSPAAADLLIVSAFLAPDSIPYEILIKGASKLGDLLSAALTDAARDARGLNRLLTHLAHYSLIRRQMESRTYAIHRFVQEVLRDTLDEPAQRLWAERVLRAINQTTPKGDIEFAHWPLCERLVPHWDACAGEIARYDWQFAEAGRLLNQAGYYLDDRARYAEAEPMYLRALEIKEKALGPDHPDTATSLNNLAILYDNQGRYAEAEPMCRRALAIREQALGPHHLDTASSLNNLAILYNNQGRYAEAEPMFRRALAIIEQALGPDHPDTASSLNNLAFLYDNQGRFAEAEPLYRRALAIREKALGPDHPDTASSLNNLAFLYNNQGRYAESEPLYRRALAIREQSLGPDHPRTATSLNNLALLYDNQGRYAEAEPLYRRALEIDERALGLDHPQTALHLENLAELLRATGREDEAGEMEDRARACREAHARRNAGPG